jgi:hypothetical protein
LFFFVYFFIAFLLFWQIWTFLGICLIFWKYLAFFWQIFIFLLQIFSKYGHSLKALTQQFVPRSRNLSSNRFFPLLFAAAEIFVQIHFRKYYLTGLNIVSVLTLLGKTENLKSV